MITNELLFIVEWMIENTLLQIILDFISKKIVRPWRTPQDDNRFDPWPFMWIVKHQEMGHSTKKSKWIIEMSGALAVGKQKDETTKFIYCQEKAKLQMHGIRHKRLSLGNAQVCDEIF